MRKFRSLVGKLSGPIGRLALAATIIYVVSKDSDREPFEGHPLQETWRIYNESLRSVLKDNTLSKEYKETNPELSKFYENEFERHHTDFRSASKKLLNYYDSKKK